MRVEQVCGALMVALGVVLAAMPATAAAGSRAAPALHAEPRWVVLCLLSFAFPSLASIIKEQLFKDAQQRLGGRPLDVFVVNSFGSLAQVTRSAASMCGTWPGFGPMYILQHCVTMM